MRKKLLIVFSLVLLALSGCGKNEKVNIEDDYNQLTETASRTDAVSFDETSVPERLEYELAENMGRVCVSADVIKDGCDRAYVYKVNEATFDEQYADELAKRIFDSSEYSVELPYRVRTESQLLEEYQSSVSEYESDTQKFVYTYKIAQLEELLNSYSEISNVCDKNPDTMFYHGRIKSRTVGAVVEDSYKSVNCALLKGKIDGRHFGLSLIRDDEGDDDYIWLYTEDEGIRFVRNYVEYDETVGSVNVGNPCDYEQSKDIAEEMIDLLMNGEDYRICQVFERMVNSDEANVITPNGFRFVYLPCINETIPSFNSLDVAGFEDDSYKKQPYVCIDVDANGFISAKYSISLELDTVLSSDANMFSFDHIDNQVKKHYQEMLDMGYSPNLTFDRVQFSYILSEADGGTAFVPCWIYYLDKSGAVWSQEEGICGVNALDGSLITFVSNNQTFTVSDQVF